MNFEVVKGSEDVEPKKAIKINMILDIIRKNFESFGFRPFDTPTIEYLSTLVNKYEQDAEIVGEIFKLSDRGKRKLGLRYDLTVPLCRYVAMKKQLKLPFRRYQIGKVFRDGPIKKGRQREFIQCDGDVIGVGGVEIEVELLSLFSKTYSELNIDYVIEVNNNKILRGAFLQFGFKKKDLSKLILSVDKLKKIGEEKVLDEMQSNGFDKNKCRDVLNLFKAENISELKSKAKNEILLDGICELESLVDSLKKLDIKFRINFSMSRGLDIYTGNIWEVYEKQNKITSSLGSGGRYDKIVAEFQNSDKQIPAVGISFGLVPILECIEIEEKESVTQVLIVPLKKEFVVDVNKISEKLRCENLNVEICYFYKLKKAFSYAEYLGCENIAVIGDEEIKSKKVMIKNLKTKEEKEFKF